MPRLKLSRFHAKPPAPEVTAHYVRYYHGRDLHYAPDTLTPITAETLFGASGPLVIDLGCGRGEYVIQQALERPGEWFVGFDWHQKSMWDAVNRAQRAGLENLRYVRADFRQALVLVPDESVSEATMLFPPPSVTSDTRKRDPLPESTLRDIYRVLLPGAEFQFVTDHAEYFDLKQALIEASGLFAVEAVSQTFEGGQTRYQRFWEGFEIESRRLACRKLE